MAPLRQLLAPGLLEWSQVDVFRSLPRVEGRVARLYIAGRDGYDYSHHASLSVHQGLLYAFWSNGSGGEDRPGQVQRCCLCGDDGVWGVPRLLARAPMNAERWPQTTTVINGGTALGAPRLTSFYSEYKGRPADGAGGEGKWSLPVLTGALTLEGLEHAWVHHGALLEDFLLNEGPRRTTAGRWLMTGEDHLGRTRLAFNDAEDPAEAAWTVVEVSKGAGSHHKNEPTWYERDAGTLVLLLRDDGGSNRLWLAESDDGGESWSEPQPTDLADATSKPHAGCLSNGLRYIISNPNRSGQRVPLTIALSRDGEAFDRLAVLRDEPTAPRLGGRFKGPGYQYPHAVEHDGALHVIYSVNKEEVEVLSLPLPALDALPAQRRSN